MRILKAYADAGKTGKQGLNLLPAQTVESVKGKRAPAKQASGDSLSISPEARALLEGTPADLIMSGPQDATYDQNGNVMRQFDDLQNDLRHLAAQVGGYGDGLMAGKLGGVRAQLANLRAQV